MEESSPNKIIIPITFLPLDEGGVHLLIDAAINGNAIKLLIDTGASKTVFDKKRIKKIFGKTRFRKHNSLSVGLGTSRMRSHMIELRNFSIGELTIHNFESVLLNLNNVNKSYQMLGLPAIDGVLGGDILQKHKAEINYGEKILVLKM
jgi:predicted aspartyl protease